jgi:thymidylate synthase ThyX
LVDLRAKLKDMEDKVVEIQQAGEAAWENAKSWMEVAMEDLEKAYEQAVSRSQSV